MPGGDLVGTQFHGVIEEGLELDFGIAQDVRIRRPPGLVFAQEFGKDALAVFGGEIHDFYVDTDPVGDTHHIDQILTRRTVLLGVVVFPVLHEQADHLPALLFQQQGRHGGIDTAGQADHYSFFRHRAQPPSSIHPAAGSPRVVHYQQTSYRPQSGGHHPHPAFQSRPSNAPEKRTPSDASR